MRIAINTRLLLPGRLEGIGWFIHETVTRMARAHPGNEYHLIFDRKIDDITLPGNCHVHITGIPARHPVLFYLWFEFSLPRLLRRISPDVFLSPDGFMSLRAKVPSVQVLHDINFEHDRFGIPRDKYWYYRFFFRRFARRADRIATVSEFSKEDIASTYGIPASRIDVVYDGQNECYTQLGPERISETRSRLTAGRPYFLYVGSLHGRKNIPRLLLAYDRFREMSGADVPLVIAGDRMFGKSGIPGTLRSMSHGGDVIFTGRISNEELQDVLGAALGMVFVSLFEGFGLPVLEAFQAGIPLICSDRTSLPEVAGDAALLVDPYSVEDIAEAMRTIHDDEELRATLINRGLTRKEMYTWDRTASLLHECLLKTVRDQAADQSL